MNNETKMLPSHHYKQEWYQVEFHANGSWICMPKRHKSIAEASMCIDFEKKDTGGEFRILRKTITTDIVSAADAKRLLVQALKIYE